MTTCPKCKTVFKVTDKQPAPSSMLIGDANGSDYAPAMLF